ncbi:MAG: cysteine desulfurase [Flavobacteriaceae bacterium]
MKKVYLDNAATTPIASEVIEVMQLSMQENFGNPSSIHQYGRTAKTAVENARKKIASFFNATASEIIFTAGGTEADNLILFNAISNLGVTRIISSRVEHHAVLHTIEFLEKEHGVEVVYLDTDANGSIDLNHLETLLKNTGQKTLVSLMYINNEIGTILPLQKVSELCKMYSALFHSDTVQAIGHYEIDLQTTTVDFIAASAHKFHGPKGVGFAYFRKGFGIKPMLHGGDQEKGARSSTENVHSILGMEKALELASSSLEEDKIAMNSLKSFFIDELKKINDKVQFNGVSSDLENSSCTILNVLLPVKNEMLLFSLDLHGIAVSGGSACQSGSSKGSHVLAEILNENEEELTSVRFSFSRYTQQEEIEYALTKIKALLS